MLKKGPEQRANTGFLEELTQKQLHVLEEYRKILEEQEGFIQRFVSQYENLPSEKQKYVDEREVKLSDRRSSLWDQARNLNIPEFKLQAIDFEFMSPEARENAWHDMFHEGPDMSPRDFYALAEMFNIPLERSSDS